jgi:hypothetical protein
MDLVNALFSIARQISDGDLNEINKLEEKAKGEVITYHTDMKGLKGLYAKLHRGWMFQLGLVFIIPFAVNYFVNLKSQILTKGTGGNNEDFEDYEDEDEEELFKRLRSKYE